MKSVTGPERRYGEIHGLDPNTTSAACFDGKHEKCAVDLIVDVEDEDGQFIGLEKIVCTDRCHDDVRKLRQ